jgi:2-succinyl-5-enolpyruvyl-6-hydroxy-3-cyclohexene-1-carboxylate synthase
MTTYYTDEKNVQVLIALLKVHGIKKVIASPGTTNITFVRSMQNDPYFQMYSAVDERSAAYIACGLATESQEPVVITCTGATASRNYLSGLTEAYYRKLPILSVTATREISMVGHNIAQVIDRSIMPKDTVRKSIVLPLVKDDVDLWNVEIKVNDALLELRRHGGGPVHINLSTRYTSSFETKELPKFRVINRITREDVFPALPKGKISILMASHSILNERQIASVERFCATHDAVVFTDHTSGYNGKYSLIHSLSSSQRLAEFDDLKPDLTIHIGEITGDYSSSNIIGKEVWRVCVDGEIRDTFTKLRYIFEMPEHDFFDHYSNNEGNKDQYVLRWKDHLDKLRTQIPDLPFSNVWVASKIHHLIPEHSAIHFAILNSLRSWNFFDISKTINSNSNVGGFGIDGCMSSLIGASLANKNKLYFGIIGDLSFFYDLNSLGNRNVGKNLRIILINNGTGTEFRNFMHFAAAFGESADEFIAAGGHNGNKSLTLVKNYSESLGFEYLSASSKDEFEKVYERFLTKEILDKSIILEVFTNTSDESKAIEIITSISKMAKSQTKNTIIKVLGKENIKKIKKLIKDIS